MLRGSARSISFFKPRVKFEHKTSPDLIEKSRFRVSGAAAFGVAVFAAVGGFWLVNRAGKKEKISVKSKMASQGAGDR